MIDPAALKAVAEAIKAADPCRDDEWDYSGEALAAITAYEAAKAQTLALLVTPDRGRRVEHPMAAKPVAEPVAWMYRRKDSPPDLGWRLDVGLPVFSSPEAWEIVPLPAPASKDGG